MNDEIMVSICCLTYNQEKYIRQTLDGFLMQECDFKYEIIIHDDASTDNTPNIIKEYELKYPDIIKPIYQSENQYSKGVSISTDIVYSLVKGRYVALCEGDDYWIDSSKLQKQVDAMEMNTDCHICLHRVCGVNSLGEQIDIMYPNFNLDSGVFSGEQLLDYICTNEYVFQTSSYFMRKIDLLNYSRCIPNFKKVAATGDTPYLLYFSTLGSVYYINKVMSCYRHTSIDDNPRKQLYMDSEAKIVSHYNKQIRMMEEFDKYTNRKYHFLCQRKIDGYYFDKAMRNHNYKELCKIKYSYFKKNWSFKEKLSVYYYAYFHYKN